MRLPEKKKPGDPVLAADWNLLLEAIAARTPRPGQGLELVAVSGGFAYSRPGNAAHRAQSLPPFGVIGIAKQEGDYRVTIKEGWVIERRAKSTDQPTVKFYMPVSGMTKLDTIPRPQITMSVGDTLWCRIRTDPSGDITGTPELQVAADDPSGTHSRPQDPDASGTNGDYYVKLLKLEDTEGGPTVKVYQQSDIEHWATLWTGENTGGGARVFKTYDDAGNVYRFRSLTGRAASPQVTVSEDGDVIRVTGNGKAGSLVLTGAYTSPQPLLEWDDGLMTTNGQVALTVKEYMVCEYGTPVSVKFLVIE